MSAKILRSSVDSTQVCMCHSFLGYIEGRSQGVRFTACRKKEPLSCSPDATQDTLNAILEPWRGLVEIVHPSQSARQPICSGEPYRAEKFLLHSILAAKFVLALAVAVCLKFLAAISLSHLLG